MDKETFKKLPVVGGILHVTHQKMVKIKVNRKRKPVFRAEAEKALTAVRKLAPAEKRIFFCAVPIHNNLGDQAQAHCIRGWISEHFPDYDCVEFTAWPFYDSGFRKLFEALVCPGNIIVVQSGYCTTEAHYNHRVHRYLAKTFMHNKILFMPQTVNFIKEKEARITGEIYGRNKNILFLTRDKKSDEYARKYFKETEVRLFPDIVTSLIGTYDFNEKRSGVLLCVRNDGEKYYTAKQLDSLRAKFSEAGITSSVTDTNYDGGVTDYKREFLPCFNKKLTELARAEVVITDRYHGTIFSMITNTPVIVLATRDHKVKTGTEWFRGVYDGAYYNADSLEEAYELALKIKAEGKAVKNSRYFKEKYYDVLPQMLNGTGESHG